MARNFFHLVPQILAENKFVDVSVPAIIRAAFSGEYKAQFVREFWTKDFDGTDVSVSLMVNVGGSIDSWLGWSAALLMHSTRIDCIDHEYGYLACTGERMDGWHRHIWCEKLKEAETKKIPIDGFDGCATIQSFLYRVARVMNITWDGADDADLFEFKK
jgi:hypothetical protein